MKNWEKIKKLGGEGILTQQDIADFSTQRARVLHLMLDGHWHTADQICSAARGREGLRRLRELREIPNVFIDRERCAFHHGDRQFKYRLIIQKPTATQRELF